jgi:hypothetical protein
MYFDKFRKIYYDFSTGKKNNDLMVVTDITQNVRFRKAIVENVVQWEYYYMKDGETFEMVSEKLYGSPLYHWVLMILNERYDYINDTPMSQPQLDEHVTKKYGYSNINAIHHYEDAEGNIVNSGVGTTPISNSLHEDRVNEAKRKIKILAPAILFTVLEIYRKL